MVRRRSRKLNFKFAKKLIFPLFRLSLKVLPLVVVAFSVFFIFSGVKQMLHADPYFKVEKITVIPGGILTSSELSFLESRARGLSLLEINLRELSEILERNPKVLRAEVVRVLPKQLNIYVTRRLPLIQVQTTPGGPYYLLSNDQLVLSKSATQRLDLILVEDFSSNKKNYSIGTIYQNSEFVNLIEIADVLRNDPAFQKENVAKLVVDHSKNMSIILKDGLELKIGKRLNLSEAGKVVLGSLLRSKERVSILYLDLRYRDIIVKKKNGIDL